MACSLPLTDVNRILGAVGTNAMEKRQLVLTADEKQYLIGLLQTALGDTRVEVHHTRTPGYREGVLEQEELIRRILEKLQA
jgi:hypothetical protein